jgi:hypothetical protein
MTLDKVLALLNLQIIKKEVVLPKKTDKPKIIKHNNQAISNGVMDEKSKINVRSKTEHREFTRRIKESFGED